MTHPFSADSTFKVASKHSRLAGQRSAQRRRLEKYSAPKIDIASERIEAVFSNFNLSGDEGTGEPEVGLYEAHKAQKRYRLEQIKAKGDGRIGAEKVNKIVKALQRGVGHEKICQQMQCGKDTVIGIRNLM